MNTEKSINCDLIKKVKRKNRAWVTAYFGCALGAGILFIPVQAGQAGIYESIVTMLLSFIVMYLAQKYFTIILNRAKTNRGFDKSIEEYLGAKWSLVISILYILIMYAAMVAYATAINASIPELLDRYGFADASLSRNPLFTLILIVCFTIFPMISERFLLAVMERISQALFVLLVITGLMFIPYWNLEMFSHVELNWYIILKNFLLCFPIFLYATIYYPTISPLVTDYKTTFPELSVGEREKNVVLVTKRASILLGVFVMFFTISAVLALTPGSLERAIQQNTSTLAVIGFGEQNVSTYLHVFRIVGFLTLISALTTSYYGSVLGIVDITKGLFPEKYSRLVENLTNISMALILYIIVILNIKVLDVIGIVETPIAGFIVFIIPIFLFYTRKQFKNNRGSVAIIVGLSGILVMFSFLLGRILP